MKMQDNSYSKEELEQMLDKEQQEFEEYKAALKVGCCHLCGMKISYFNEHEKCLHWFLLPDGIKKVHLGNYLMEEVSFCQLENYLRLVANSVEMYKHINDTSDLSTTNKLLETTIRYKNIEWSFNISKTDFEGHGEGKMADYPHFHMQIMKDNKPFIRFNDYHIAYTKGDLIQLHQAFETGEKLYFNFFGMGASVIEHEKAEELLESYAETHSYTDYDFQTRISLEFPQKQEKIFDKLEDAFKKGAEKPSEIKKNVEETIEGAKATITRKIGNGVVTKKNRNKRNGKT